MGASQIPASSKTRYVVTLTSGVSWTVPAGVTYVNATLFGGGGGSSGSRAAINSTDYGQAGKPGAGGQVITSNVSTTPGAAITYAIGAGGTAGFSTADGGAGGNTTFTGATTASGGTYVGSTGQGAGNGGIGNLGSSASGNAGGSGKIEIEYWV